MFILGVSTLKAHQVFSVHTKPEKFTNTIITSHFGFVFDWTKSHDHLDVIVFDKKNKNLNKNLLDDGSHTYF